MAYVTLADGYQPGGTTLVPANILVLNAQGVATGGLLRDIYNTNPSLIDLPYQLVRGEQTVDNFEVGIKADWLDGRFRTNVTVFQTDWQNMTGSTYVATVWWDLDGNGFAEARVPCAARCDGTNTYEVNYFPNLLTSAVLEAESSGVEIEATWGGGENYQLGFNLGLLDTAFVELGQAGEGTVPAYNEGDKFAGAPDMTANLWGQYDWSLTNGAQPLGAARLHVDGRLHGVRGRSVAAHAGGVRPAQCAARVRPRQRLAARSRRHQPHRGVLHPGVLLHGVATDVGWQRRPAARGLLGSQLRRSIDRIVDAGPRPLRGPVSFALDSPD